MVDAGSSHTAVSFWEWPECTACGDVLHGTPEQGFQHGIGAVAQAALHKYKQSHGDSVALPDMPLLEAEGAVVLAAVASYMQPIMDHVVQHWKERQISPGNVFFFLKASTLSHCSTVVL